jgi:hypothetical protein
MFSKCEF